MQTFQIEMQSKDKTEGQDGTDKSEVFKEIYNILLDVADDFSEKLLSNLLCQSVNILESLYSDLIDTEKDLTLSCGLKDYVKKELEDYDTEECEWWNTSFYTEGEF